MDNLPNRRTSHGITFYTTFISVDLAQIELYRDKFAIGVTAINFNISISRRGSADESMVPLSY